MIKATLVVSHTSFLNNRFFSSDTKIIRDHQNDCFVKLREKLKKIGIDLATEDINLIDKSKLVIYLDINQFPRKNSDQFNYLIINEPPTVHSRNWNKANHRLFDKIFTWYRPFVDNKKYFFLRFGYFLDSEILKKPISTKRKLCTTIVGYKQSYHPKELYSERLKAIKWFARNHPEVFDLYGQGWENYLIPTIFRKFKIFIPIRLIRNLLDKEGVHRTYRGTVFSKKATLCQYKYSICYENTKDYFDLVTEKIFDSMCAGCVPIYLGASNIDKLIPANCFIDKRKFKNYSQLYNYLIKLTDKKYLKMVQNIINFLSSNKVMQFTSDNYAETIIKQIENDLRTDIDSS